MGIALVGRLSDNGGLHDAHGAGRVDDPAQTKTGAVQKLFQLTGGAFASSRNNQHDDIQSLNSWVRLLLIDDTLDDQHGGVRRRGGSR